jgi:hypothetical protein
MLDYAILALIGVAIVVFGRIVITGLSKLVLK